MMNLRETFFLKTSVSLGECLVALVPFQLVGNRCQGINFEPYKTWGEAGGRKHVVLRQHIVLP